jgi:protein-tyrosine phosphatase
VGVPEGVTEGVPEGDPTREMVDIHCHVLPDVDDGAPTMEVALEMLRRGAEDGTRVAVLTPHIKAGGGQELTELHHRRLDELREAAEAADIGVELHQGAELEFRFGLEEVAQWPTVGLAGSQYVLVDLPPGPLSPWLDKALFALRAAGFRPILAHPERHRELAMSRSQMEGLRQQDLLFQVTAGSFTGRFGRRAQATAEMMLGEGWVEFVASDAHNLDKRPFSLRSARARVEELGGPDQARRLFYHNPRALIRGEPITVDRPSLSSFELPAPSGWRRLLQRFF